MFQFVNLWQKGIEQNNDTTGVKRTFVGTLKNPKVTNVLAEIPFDWTCSNDNRNLFIIRKSTEEPDKFIIVTLVSGPLRMSEGKQTFNLEKTKWFDVVLKKDALSPTETKFANDLSQEIFTAILKAMASK